MQLRLGTEAQPGLVDTLVMSNLGYFQLKAAPGVWDLQLAPGGRAGGGLAGQGPKLARSQECSVARCAGGKRPPVVGTCHTCHPWHLLPLTTGSLCVLH